MKLILVDIQLGLCETFEEYFKGLPNVEVVNDCFENLPAFDCMVSAANSFGIMDGGVDAAILSFFGRSLMEKVQRRILDEYLGEQLVGTSFIVETGHPKHPYVAHTPTMRVPMTIARTDNIYRAMWAMLLAVRNFSQSADRPINIVACPGLGTATGRVPFREAARQMSLAYKNFLKPPPYINWTFADKRQAEIRYGGDIGFAFPPQQ